MHITPGDIAPIEQAHDDDGAGRRMRRNAVDMPMGLGALTVRQSTVEFTGKAQKGPVATKCLSWKFLNRMNHL